VSASGHSKFSASSAYRLLTCPGSFDLGQKADPGSRRSTVFSAEGTLAHSLSEAALFSAADLSTLTGRAFHADGFDFTVDEDFIEAVETYVDFVRSLEALGYVIALETRVSPAIHWTGLADLGLELFGTADCIAYHPDLNKLLIVDLKFGKGIAVEVADNAQFLYYAAGSLSRNVINAMLEAHGRQTLPPGWTPSEVETIVVQPRAHHPDGPIRRQSYDPAFVRRWAQTTLYEGVDKALKDKGTTLVAGDHCRFCPALPHCPAYKTMLDTEAKNAFLNAPATNTPAANLAADDDPLALPVQPVALAVLPPTHISDEELGELLDKVALLKPYFAALEELAMDRLKKARPVKGWQTAPTRTKRIWNDDEQSVASALRAAGLSLVDVAELKLLTPAQLEKKLGKAKFKQILAKTVPNLVTRSAPGKTLVPDGDPRARLNQHSRTPQQAFGIPEQP